MNDLHDNLTILDTHVYGENLLTELEETIGLRGWLRNSRLRNTTPLPMINQKYGTHFMRINDALKFMDERVEEAKQRARQRMTQYRNVA